jgi:isopenicillin N synthase-like dioxygenase
MNAAFSIPVVDFTSAGAPQAFCNSLKQTGFAVLKNHPLQQSTVEGIYNEWLSFFKSGAARNYPYDQTKFDGHFSTQVSETAKGNTVKDSKEFFHIYPWGRYPSEVSDAARRYYASASELAAKLLGWIEEQSPPEVKARYRQPLPQMIEGSEQTLLRVLHYPPLTGNELPGSVRAAAHEDINLITLLPAANEPGLQVKTSDGNWLDVPCDFGLLIVNIGDMLQEASGHYYPSTSHRVLNPTGEGATRSRVSLPLFLHPRPDVVLSDRYSAASYLAERLRELGRKV